MFQYFILQNTAIGLFVSINSIKISFDRLTGGE